MIGKQGDSPEHGFGGTPWFHSGRLPKREKRSKMYHSRQRLSTPAKPPENRRETL